MNSTEQQQRQYGDDNEDEVLYQVPPSVVALLSCFYGLISLAALIGNSLVIYVVAVAPRMRTVTNFYIANLAFADVTIALFAIPFQVGQSYILLYSLLPSTYIRT